MPSGGVSTSAATPAAFSVPVPSEAAPLRKVTVPVGVLPLPAVTVAVNVSVRPAYRVVGVAMRVVVVTAGFTVTVIGGDDTDDASVEEPP